MAKKDGGNGGAAHVNPRNEVDTLDPGAADTNGKGLYGGGWDEVLKRNLTRAPIDESANTLETRDSYGHGVPGEPKAEKP
jgi:hypothetical protein